jgi:DNA polymerase-3 subunit delta
MGSTTGFDLLLSSKGIGELPAVVAVFGHDGFLRQQSIKAIVALTHLKPEEVRTFDQDDTLWRDVHDELVTVSLFEPDQRRVAVVRNADSWLAKCRTQLEKWCASPVPASLLILELNTFPTNTKLYKMVAEKGWCVECAPRESQISAWMRKWGRAKYGVELTADQADLIQQLVGDECGLLDQELAKIALYASDQGLIDDDRLRQAVGSWRTQTVWQIIAVAADGRAAEALAQLQRLIDSGESPMAIMPLMSWSLRRFGMAAQLILQAERAGRSLGLREALLQSGFRSNEVQQAEKNLRRLGRGRAGRLLDWLLQLDLKLKGSHSKDSRGVFALEELIVKLATEAA